MKYLEWIAEHWVLFLVTLYLVLYFAVNGAVAIVALLKNNKPKGLLE